MAKRYSTTKVAPSDIPSTGKYTRYNRETMDYDAFFDGQYLGSRESMDEVRDLVNEHVYDLERSGMMYTATELDGGSSVEEIAADTESAPIPPGEGAVAVEYLYYDATHPLRDLTEEARGPLAYTTYVCGCGDEKADIAFKMDGSAGPEISLFNDDPRPLATVLAAVANLQMLLADPRVHAALYGITPPAAPAVIVETWNSGEYTYTDFHAGSKLTGVMIGTYDESKPGIELVVGGKAINECSDEVLTLADIRQLRDNLTALLNDPRLVSAVEGAPQPPTPAAPAVALIDHGDDWLEYRVDRVRFHVEDGMPSCLTGLGIAHDLSAADRQDVRDIYTLLSDTRVQACMREPEAAPRLRAA